MPALPLRLEGILGARRAPAFAQGTKIHLLHWVDFIPEGDVEVRRQIAEYQKQTKVEVIVRDHQRQRPAAAHHRGDPVRLRPRHHHDAAQLAAPLRDGLADVSDLAEWKAKDQGGYYALRGRRQGRQAAGWPCRTRTGAPLIAYRKSWFAEAGAPQPPKTLEE